MILSGFNISSWLELTGFIWLRTWSVAGCCEDYNELSGSIKYWEILWAAERLEASQEGLRSMQLINSSAANCTFRRLPLSTRKP
jgi:hypothetical protein